MKKNYLTTFFFTFLLLADTAFCVETETRFHKFEKDLSRAYTEYRIALFLTNQQNETQSFRAAERFQKQWKEIVFHYAASPPEIYSGDSQWKHTLLKVHQIIQDGIREMKEGEVAQAHETLELIRDELSELRRRNNVITFSDHINNYHEQMEHLLKKKYSVETLTSKAIRHIRESCAVLEYLAKKIQGNAPAEYLKNPEFQEYLDANFMVLKMIRRGLEEKAHSKIIQAIQQLKPAYAKLFIKFG